MVYLAIKVSLVLEEEAGVATAWVEEMGVDTDCVVVVAVVITACGTMVDIAWEEETTMELAAGVLEGVNLDVPEVEEVLVDMNTSRLVSAWEMEGVDMEGTELLLEVTVGWSHPGW